MTRRAQLFAAAAGAMLIGAPVWAAHSPCVTVAPGGTVDGIALAQLLAHWTGASAYAPCPPVQVHDFNEDCRVNGLDLAQLLAAWGQSCRPVVTQLAGNPLAQYPYFEYVRAFNQGSPMSLAIDPNRFPAVVGQTCLLYVVAHKTPAQWAADPSLSDITAGGSQTQTFAAGLIQENTFTISGGSALNGTLGTQVGVGYDVILDCNHNGVLDAADFMDGFSDEAGLYVVRDTAAPGPYTPVTSEPYAVTGVAPTDALEQAFYPADITSLGRLPLIVVGHGGGHNYLWYSHLGTHMASYGYIVVSHQNSGGGGGANTIRHTNAIIGQQATILGGVLDGHIDADAIAWVGHSRGGDGVMIAYDHLFDGTPINGGPHVPVGWSIDSIRLIDAMAPVQAGGLLASNPHGVNFHMWWVAGDSDVTGCPGFQQEESFQAHDRATGVRQSTTIYGAGHGDLHSGGGGALFTGPCPIGRPAVNQIQRGYWVPLFARYLRGDLPAKDFLWRQWERFKPIGAPAAGACPSPSGTGEAVVVHFMYRDDPAAAAFIIDDYGANPSPSLSSSGGSVTFTVSNLFEGRLDDTIDNFSWTPADPMNGMIHVGVGDTSSGVVFDWTGPAYYEQAISPAQQDWTSAVYLSFRACQGTRHPNTAAALEDLTFEVVLRDAAGVTSRINIAAYGGGVEEPYQRTSCGPGAGWNNEFETIRIRVADFLTNESGLDLSHVAAVRFDFAAPGRGSSATGRLGLSEIYLTRD